MKKLFLSMLLIVVSGFLFYPGIGYGDVREVTITVDADGFNPAQVDIKRGEAIRLVFIRKIDKTCATRVLIPDMKVDAELPLNKPVIVEISSEKTGEIGFACPMNMLKGKINAGSR